MKSKFSQQEILKRAKDMEKRYSTKVLDVRYDYMTKESKYKVWLVKITCVDCGAEKWVRYNSLVKGERLRCKECSGHKKHIYKEVLERAKEKEKEYDIKIIEIKFDYTTEKSKTKTWLVKHTCPTCGKVKEKWTLYKNFINEKGLKCKECGMKQSHKTQTYSEEEVLENVKSKEKKYNIKVIDVKYDYPTEDSKHKYWLVKHTCSDCGKETRTQYNNFIKGKCLRCRECGGKLDYEEVLNNVKSKEVEYNIKAIDIEHNCTNEINKHKFWMIKHTCPDCGEETRTRYNDFMEGVGVRCKNCRGESLGELIVQKFLDESNIKYKRQYDTLNCIGPKGAQLPYDFELVDYKIIIEVQGSQHYKFNKYFFESQEDFEYRQECDKTKKDYAISKGYTMIFINNLCGTVIEGQEDHIQSGEYKNIILNIIKNCTQS